MKMNRRGLIASAMALAVVPKAKARTRVRPRHFGSGIYAVKGEKTYCAQGCQLGEFGNTVYVGATTQTGDLIPAPGMYIGAYQCPFCEAQVTSNHGAYYFAV